MKKILLSSIVISASLYAAMSQQEFLYKDPRVMGMGAANTAVGGYSSAVFYNPAGLIRIKKSHGFEVELLGFGLSASKDFKNFADDVINTETETDVIDVLGKYSGNGFHASASNYSSFSYHTESDLAYSVGILAASDANFIPHIHGGSAGLLETHSRGYGGVVLAAAKEYKNVLGLGGKFSVGLGLKYIMQKSYEVGLDADDLLAHQDDLMEYLQDTYEKNDQGFGVDIGVLYEIPYFASWHPTIGFSVMNIGTLNFDNTYGSQPITLNAGMAVTKKLPVVNTLTIALDYVDLTNQQQVRVSRYNTEETTNEFINKNKEYDALQHIRFGIKADIFDNSLVTTSLMGGFYQGSYTAGLDLQLALMKLQAATYQEQLGSLSGQIEDRRYMVGLGIGW